MRAALAAANQTEQGVTRRDTVCAVRQHDSCRGRSRHEPTDADLCADCAAPAASTVVCGVNGRLALEVVGGGWSRIAKPPASSVKRLRFRDSVLHRSATVTLDHLDVGMGSALRFVVWMARRLRSEFVAGQGTLTMLRHRLNRGPNRRLGSIAVEYILLATIVGIGLIVGLACVRDALVAELKDLALAIRLLL
jgi:pilus assembly protein Flp/PilA